MSSRRSSPSPTADHRETGVGQRLLHPDAALSNTRRPSSSTASPTPSDTSDDGSISAFEEDSTGVVVGTKGAKSVTFRDTEQKKNAGKLTGSLRRNKSKLPSNRPSIVVSRAGPTQVIYHLIFSTA